MTETTKSALLADILRWSGEVEPVRADEVTVADKCRWWLEEYARRLEAGDSVRAQAILYSLIGLFYRLENALKQR